MPSDLGMPADLSKVPEFLQAVDSNGDVVGYLRRSDLMPQAPDGALLIPKSSVDVFSSDGKTVVGQMVAGAGFVSNDSQSVDPTPTTLVEVPSDDAATK